MEVPKSLPGSGMAEHRLQTGKDKTLQETMKLSGCSTLRCLRARSEGETKIIRRPDHDEPQTTLR